MYCLHSCLHSLGIAFCPRTFFHFLDNFSFFFSRFSFFFTIPGGYLSSPSQSGTLSIMSPGKMKGSGNGSGNDVRDKIRSADDNDINLNSNRERERERGTPSSSLRGQGQAGKFYCIVIKLFDYSLAKLSINILIYFVFDCQHLIISHHTIFTLHTLYYS